MASVNKVILIGNVGRDPEQPRYSASGGAILNVSIATTRSWKDKASGEKREETEWHRVVFYDRLAEIVHEYAKKGRALYVEGRLKTRKWQDKDGVEKYTTEIVAEEMQLLGSRDGGGGGGGSGEGGGGSRDSAQGGYSREPAQGGYSREPAQGSGGGFPRERAPAGGAGGGRSPAPSKSGPGDFDNMDDDIPF
jgi:single-strand DNA-binding protein